MRLTVFFIVKYIPLTAISMYSTCSEKSAFIMVIISPTLAPQIPVIIKNLLMGLNMLLHGALCFKQPCLIIIVTVKYNRVRVRIIYSVVLNE